MKCEDSDKGCKVHKGQASCDKNATELLMRIDMEDETGVWMCEACAEDAGDSGVFRSATIKEKINNRR